MNIDLKPKNILDIKPEKIFDLKPRLTTAMRIAASVAITYYGLLFVYSVITLILCRYFVDSFYLEGETPSFRSRDFLFLIIGIILTGMLMFSLIQIFRKKVHGKAIFVLASILLIGFQFFSTGLYPWYKYAMEILLLLIITPVRIKSKRIGAKETRTAKVYETIEPEEKSGTASNLKEDSKKI